MCARACRCCAYNFIYSILLIMRAIKKNVIKLEAALTYLSTFNLQTLIKVRTLSTGHGILA